MDSYFSLVNVVAAAIFVMFLNKKYRSHQENKTTASSLSLVSPPTSLPHRKYHVFPSFHGPDVRTVFLSHLLKEFKSKGINAFIDNNMERGELIGPELKEAIRGSRVAIVLLSKNYASSTWCLSELVEIMESREKLDQTVIPIFYEVDPTDIKKQIGDFGKVFTQTCEGKTKEEIRSWKHALTEVAQITGHHSTNWYAFGQKSPKDGFTELVWEVISLVGRLPLGLRVMGSYFRRMCKEDWTKVLPSLKTHLDPGGEIESILKFSYDALRDEDKILFLHIACFFSHERVDRVEGCLASCFLGVTHGLCVLAQKSLISMNSGSIKMQELLVQLGKKIVREQSVSEPGKRQFLNDTVDIGDVLNDDKAGSSSVLGIDDLDGNITCKSERAFERLSNLQFLRICSDGINPQSLNSISRKLRFLSWKKFGMSYFPSSFNPKFLVNLIMRESKLEKLWEGTRPLNNLKWMDLSESYGLKELPDLSSATNIYDLNLSYCSSLVKLSSSIGNATNLQRLDLSYCSSLVELPSSMRNLRKLSKLVLVGCSKLEVPLANINLES